MHCFVSLTIRAVQYACDVLAKYPAVPKRKGIHDWVTQVLLWVYGRMIYIYNITSSHKLNITIHHLILWVKRKLITDNNSNPL